MQHGTRPVTGEPGRSRRRGLHRPDAADEAVAVAELELGRGDEEQVVRHSERSLNTGWLGASANHSSCEESRPTRKNGRVTRRELVVAAEHRHRVLGRELLDRERLASPTAPELDVTGGTGVPDPVPVAVGGDEPALAALLHDRYGSRPRASRVPAGDREKVGARPREPELRERAHETVQGAAPDAPAVRLRCARHGGSKPARASAARGRPKAYRSDAVSGPAGGRGRAAASGRDRASGRSRCRRPTPICGHSRSSARPVAEISMGWLTGSSPVVVEHEAAPRARRLVPDPMVVEDEAASRRVPRSDRSLEGVGLNDAAELLAGLFRRSPSGGCRTRANDLRSSSPRRRARRRRDTASLPVGPHAPPPHGRPRRASGAAPGGRSRCPSTARRDPVATRPETCR